AQRRSCARGMSCSGSTAHGRTPSAPPRDEEIVPHARGVLHREYSHGLRRAPLREDGVVWSWHAWAQQLRRPAPLLADSQRCTAYLRDSVGLPLLLDGMVNLLTILPEP